MSASERGSSALVGSSSTRTLGLDTSARADDRVVAGGPSHDLVMDAREAAGALDGGVVVVTMETDVLRDRGMQELRLLRNVGDALVEVRELDVGRVDPVYHEVA